MWVNGLRLEARTVIDPLSTRYAQATIGYRSQTGLTLDDSIAYASNGGQLPRVDVVRSEFGGLTSIDNRRIFVGRQAAADYEGFSLRAGSLADPKITGKP